jgi:hypothetical protein
MSRRWARWTAAGLLLLVLLAIGAWRLSREIPGQLRKAEETIREEAARKGLRVSFRNLRLRLLYPRISLDNLVIVDDGTGIELVRAESVDVSLSPGRLISGESPVSRIRFRKFTLHAEDANRPLLDRLRAGERKGQIPELLLLEGDVRIGPLGPLVRWDARVPELRIREVRFLGTRISLRAEEARGEIDLPGEGSAKWPFASLEADLFDQKDGFRIRRLRASGPSSSVKISGFLTPSRKSGEVKLSGDVDLNRWIASAAPYSRRIGRVMETGSVEFSADLAGSVENPAGTGKLTLRDGTTRGNAAIDLELGAAVSKRTIRIDSLKGKFLGGTLSGSGFHDVASGQAEGKLSLSRASFGAAPWREWGFAWRPAGTGDADIVLSGNLRRTLHAAFAFRNPAGLERADGGTEAGAGIRLPLSANASGDVSPDGGIAVSAIQVRAGGATISGAGEIRPREGRLLLGGEFSVPRGKASDYGWNVSLSWAGIAGRWGASGAAARPRVSLQLEAQSLAAGTLPPVPLAVRLEGESADAVHFVADVPAPVAKATATGTLTGPLSAAPFAVEASLALREIDFSEASRWIPAAMGILGMAPGEVSRLLAGMTGAGSGDLQVSAAKSTASVAGALQSPEIRLKGVAVREVSLEGEWSRAAAGETWKATAEGKLGEGSFRLAGTGEDGSAEVSGTADRLELEHSLSLLARGKGPSIRGPANIRFEAKNGEKGWELGHLTASSPRVSVDNTVFEEVSAEGSLGAVAGRFLLAARSPAIRVAGEVRRGGDWPASFKVDADGVPSEFLLSAAGRSGLASEGKWNVEAEGSILAAAVFSADPFPPDAITALRFSLSADAPSVSGVAFRELRVSGSKEGEVLAGEVLSGNPDSRLAFSITLREPFGFRLEGPFSFASAPNGKGKEEQRTRFALSGRADIRGALRALSNTEGSLEIRQFSYRAGEVEVTGKEISAKLSADGIRWASGTLMTAGSPLHVAGKVSWKGELDLRLDGKIPAAAIRLVTDVFDRLEGTLRVDVRIAGKWDEPQVRGTGRLDGGIFSFRGYAQVFEEMQADAVISREKLVFEHFEGRSGGGYIDGRGELPLRFGAHQRLFFSVDFFDMRFPYPEDFRPVLQGHVELLGPYDDFLVTGDVEVQSARYTKTLRPERVFIDFRKRLEDVTARREPSEFRVRLDIGVIADGTIRIKNNLADAEVRGEFKVVGDAGRIILLGAFDVNQGHVEYQGNRYELKRVTVEFQDPRRNNPRLDARAETTKGNVTVAVNVTGTLDRYEVDMTSDPPLSKNDIVALLSLGVTSRQLAGSEGAVGAGVASSLVLGPYKGRFEEGVRGVVKLDKFAIEPAFSASSKSFEPKFIVGKSFGERLSVSVSSSVGTTAESSAIAEYKLLENVYLSGAWESATTTTEGDLGADLKIRYRYREFKDLLRGRD